MKPLISKFINIFLIVLIICNFTLPPILIATEGGEDSLGVEEFFDKYGVNLTEIITSAILGVGSQTLEGLHMLILTAAASVDVIMGVVVGGFSIGLNGVVATIDILFGEGEEAKEELEEMLGKIFIGPDTIFAGDVTILNANIFKLLNKTVDEDGKTGLQQYIIALRDAQRKEIDLLKNLAEGDKSVEETLKETQDDVEKRKDELKNVMESYATYVSPSGYLVTQVGRAVAQIYILLRNICAYIMLAGLIYTGIKILLNNHLPQNRQQYLSLLQDWIVGMALLIFSHLIMVFIFEVSDLFVDIFKKSIFGMGGMNFNIFMTSLYSTDIAARWISLFMYIYLIWITLVFVIAYFKRFFFVCILTVFAPVFSIMFLFGNQFKQLYSKWLKEYAMAVFVQPFHMIVYGVLISIPLNMLKGTGDVLDISYDIFEVIYALIAMSFIRPAEKFLRSLMGMDQGIAKMASYDSGKQTIDAVKQTITKTIKNVVTTVQSLVKSGQEIVEDGGKAAIKAAGTAATTALIGAAIGSVVPGAGTAVGAAAGGAAGTAAGAATGVAVGATGAVAEGVAVGGTALAAEATTMAAEGMASATTLATEGTAVAAEGASSATTMATESTGAMTEGMGTTVPDIPTSDMDGINSVSENNVINTDGITESDISQSDMSTEDISESKNTKINKNNISDNSNDESNSMGDVSIKADNVNIDAANLVEQPNNHDTTRKGSELYNAISKNEEKLNSQYDKNKIGSEIFNLVNDAYEGMHSIADTLYVDSASQDWKNTVNDAKVIRDMAFKPDQKDSFEKFNKASKNIESINKRYNTKVKSVDEIVPNARLYYNSGYTDINEMQWLNKMSNKLNITPEYFMQIDKALKRRNQKVDYDGDNKEVQEIINQVNEHYFN